jgi:hypothetical protein
VQYCCFSFSLRKYPECKVKYNAKNYEKFVERKLKILILECFFLPDRGVTSLSLTAGQILTGTGSSSDIFARRPGFFFLISLNIFGTMHDVYAHEVTLLLVQWSRLSTCSVHKKATKYRLLQSYKNICGSTRNFHGHKYVLCVPQPL